MRRPRRSIAVAIVLATFAFAACSSSSDTDQQIADLEKQVSDLQGQLDQTQSQLEDVQQQNADLQDQLNTTDQQLADTKRQLTTTQDQLATAQAELVNAQSQLAKVGELKLKDGTYVGRVLGAKATPYRVIVFDAGGLYRVAQVADDVTITAGGSDFTLAQFGKLLASTDPNDVKLANGNYQVIVKQGLATSIRKSKR